MKNYTGILRVFIFLGLALLFSCDFIDQFFDNDSDNVPGQVLDSLTVGSNGGTLKSDSIELIIPEGAFTSPQNLQLVRMEQDSSKIEGINSEYYKLIGAFDQLQKPITIKIKPSDILDKDQDGVIVAESEITNADETYSRSTTIATDENGWLQAEVEFEDFPPEALQTVEQKSAGSYEYSWFAMTKSKQTTNHFAIYYDKNDGVDKIQKVGEILEEAVAKYRALGFDFSISSGEVYVWKIKDDGGVQQSWKTGKIHMEINNANLSNMDELKVTIGHEMFHWVQYSYDKAFWSGLKNVWLDEACAVWAESLFSANANYFPSVAKGWEFEPCQGLQKGATRLEGETRKLNDIKAFHGYGCSSLIKYLVGRYGSGIVLKIYQEIKQGIEPVYAIHKATNYQLASDWQDYLEQLMQDNIYQNPPNPFENKVLLNLTGKLDLFSDTIVTYSEEYADLSARFFQVKPQKAWKNANKNTKLKFKLDKKSLSNMETISVFKKNANKQIEFLGSTNDSIVIGDFSDDYYLFAMVVNSNFSGNPASYTNNTPIELTIETAGNPAGCQGGLFFDAVMRVNNAQGVENDSITDFMILFPYIERMTASEMILGYTEGSLTGNQYKAEWNKKISIGATADYNIIKGQLQISFDNAHSVITDLVLTDTTQTVSGNGSTNYYEKIHCNNIPYKMTSGNEKTYRIDGAAVLGSITSIQYHELYYDGSTRNLISYSASGGSIITVVFKGQQLP